MRRIEYLILILCINSSISLCGQRVNPTHGGSYYPGLMDIRDWTNPDPGLYLLDYNYWVHSDSYFDKDGNQINGETSSAFFIDPKLDVYANAPVLFYASKFTLFKAKYLASISMMYLNLTTTFTTGVGSRETTFSSNVSGFGDLTLMPLGLSWTEHERFDISFMYTMYIPTGRYEPGADDNIGQGHWTHQFQIPGYAYFMDKATALALIPTLEINGPIQNSDAKFGNRFSLEYGISQYLTEWLEIDLMNAHNWQISEDSGDEAWWVGSVLDGKDQKSIFSVGLSTWPTEKLNVRGKFITEYAVKERFKNTIWSLSFIYSPNILK